MLDLSDLRLKIRIIKRQLCIKLGLKNIWMYFRRLRSASSDSLISEEHKPNELMLVPTKLISVYPDSLTQSHNCTMLSVYYGVAPNHTPSYKEIYRALSQSAERPLLRLL
ncbi:MAG: hypothetical protein H0Z39_11725 [Peptococcaceae bacterium]|nr:hypothetical protein [Peptococcaceae bacterium]